METNVVINVAERSKIERDGNDLVVRSNHTVIRVTLAQGAWERLKQLAEGKVNQ